MTVLRKPTWMAQARRQLARYLEEATSEVAAANTAGSTSSLVHDHKPQELYLDPTKNAVVLEAPYPILPSLALPPGHAFAAQHVNGTPLLVYRDKKDPTQLRAYVNSCRHRGSPLLRPPKNEQFTTTPLKAPLLTCPYHAWTFDAQNGELKKIPGHKKAFGLMDKAAFGLKALTCTEQAGLVWVGGDTMRDNHLWWAEELDKEVEPFLYTSNSAPSEAYKVLGYREWELQANWQLIVETAMESYHVKSLHSKTFHQVTHPTWAMASHYTDDHRNAIMTFGLSCNAYYFHEAFFMSVTIEPVDAKSSKVRMWAVPHRLSDPQEEEELSSRDFDNVVVAVEEDWECMEQIQKGLAVGSSEFWFGGYEGNNVWFLDNVRQAAEKLKEDAGGNDLTKLQNGRFLGNVGQAAAKLKE